MGEGFSALCAARSDSRTTETSDGRIIGRRSGRSEKNDDMVVSCLLPHSGLGPDGVIVGGTVVDTWAIHVADQTHSTGAGRLGRQD